MGPEGGILEGPWQGRADAGRGLLSSVCLFGASKANGRGEVVTVTQVSDQASDASFSQEVLCQGPKLGPILSFPRSLWETARTLKRLSDRGVGWETHRTGIGIWGLETGKELFVPGDLESL